MRWVGFDSFTYRGRDKTYETATPGPGEYYNPILAGFYPDPNIFRAGEDYYLVNSTFAYFPGIPIFHSCDLVNWNQVGHVMQRPEQLRYESLGVSRGVFAPAITFHDGIFYVVCTMVDFGGNFVVTQKPIWIEGPHLLKSDVWYYLCCAEGGTGPGHSQVIFRSKKVDGPYTPWDRNPILTQRDLSPDFVGAVTCTGHADLVVGLDGEWWSVYLGVRPYDGSSSFMGRKTFLLPVTWTGDDWPVILPRRVNACR